MDGNFAISIGMFILAAACFISGGLFRIAKAIDRLHEDKPDHHEVDQ